MDIVIVSQYLRDIENLDTNNSRFIYLADLLSSYNHSVEIITSDFIHGYKRHVRKVFEPKNFTIRLVHEPGYKKNVSPKRCFSHFYLALQIYRYLKERNIPDCVYCAIPSLSVSFAMSLYCHRHEVPFIADVQDLWPEAFLLFFNNKKLGQLLFFPLYKLANYIYRSSDAIVAVSDTYLRRASSCSELPRSRCVSAFLGTQLSTFDSYAEVGNETYYFLQDDIVKVVYCGTLGTNYDLDMVIDALTYLYDSGITNFKFIIVGDGPNRKHLEERLDSSPFESVFTGNVSYDKLVPILKGCDIALNPIRIGAAGSVINKVGDYAMAALPVVNSQGCAEYINLLNEYNAGINVEPGNAVEFSKAVRTLVLNPDLRHQLSFNSRKLGEECFDREKIYRRIVDLIVLLSKEK